MRVSVCATHLYALSGGGFRCQSKMAGMGWPVGTACRALLYSQAPSVFGAGHLDYTNNDDLISSRCSPWVAEEGFFCMRTS